MSRKDYVIQVLQSPRQVAAPEWNALLDAQAEPTPFMRHEFLAALHDSGCATAQTGWSPHYLCLRDARGALQAACPLYVKSHSRGEYVFDWSWADAYQRHGLTYYPKAVIAVPFTPVPGSRLLARDESARQALIGTARDWAGQSGLSSLHLLFAGALDLQSSLGEGMLARETVQFHWTNRAGEKYASFDDFLAAMSQEKRKKLKQERRRVREAGVTLRHSVGTDISDEDWDFFYRCYERTYLEHGNRPYLNRPFFQAIARTLPENWLLFIAERQGRRIASSLIAIGQSGQHKVAWGRYWGAMERVDCLHFEACYYQPLQWCVEHGFDRFEGGAQGEHKLARALLPARTTSAHWLADPDFSRAIAEFLQREGQGIDMYLDELNERSPLRSND